MNDCGGNYAINCNTAPRYVRIYFQVDLLPNSSTDAKHGSHKKASETVMNPRNIMSG